MGNRDNRFQISEVGSGIEYVLILTSIIHGNKLPTSSVNIGIRDTDSVRTTNANADQSACESATNQNTTS